MKCPKCNAETKVKRTEQNIRHRECLKCFYRFSTCEVIKNKEPDEKEETKEVKISLPEKNVLSYINYQLKHNVTLDNILFNLGYVKRN